MCEVSLIICFSSQRLHLDKILSRFKARKKTPQKRGWVVERTPQKRGWVVERTAMNFGLRKANLIGQTFGFAYTAALQKDQKRWGENNYVFWP